MRIPGCNRSGAERPLRVLFVEDMPTDVKLCLRELKKAGFEVTEDVVQTPEEFLERIRAIPYDIILSDQRLPKWTGTEALECLQQEGKDIPFILVTGTLGEEAAVECIKKGASDYVLKDRLAVYPWRSVKLWKKKSDGSGKRGRSRNFARARNAILWLLKALTTGCGIGT